METTLCVKYYCLAFVSLHNSQKEEGTTQVLWMRNTVFTVNKWWWHHNNHLLFAQQW